MELFVHRDGCLDFSCAICTKTAVSVCKNWFGKKIEWMMENISSNVKHTAGQRSISLSVQIILPHQMQRQQRQHLLR